MKSIHILGFFNNLVWPVTANFRFSFQMKNEWQNNYMVDKNPNQSFTICKSDCFLHSLYNDAKKCLASLSI